MLEFIAFIFRLCGFAFLALGLPASLGAVFAGEEGALIGAGAAALLFFLDSLGVERRLAKELSPTSVSLYGRNVYRIEDASSHVFVTRAPWFGTTKIWLTRGAFSLLKHEELLRLVRYTEKNHSNYRLGFETYVTTWILRLTQRMPSALVQLLFRSEMKHRDLPIRQVLRILPILGLLSLLGGMYGKRGKKEGDVDMRVALKSLRDESAICAPNLNPAFSNHSLVNPWPEAILYFGRSCLP